MGTSSPRYWRRVAAGLCTDCAAPALPQRRKCAECTRISRETTQAKRAVAAAQGICVACLDAPRAPKRGLCCASCANDKLERTRASRQRVAVTE